MDVKRNIPPGHHKKFSSNIYLKNDFKGFKVSDKNVVGTFATEKVISMLKGKILPIQNLHSILTRIQFVALTWAMLLLMHYTKTKEIVLFTLNLTPPKIP